MADDFSLDLNPLNNEVVQVRNDLAELRADEADRALTADSNQESIINRLTELKQLIEGGQVSDPDPDPDPEPDPDPDPDPEYDILLDDTNWHLQGLRDARIFWTPGTRVPSLVLDSAINVQLVGTTPLHVEGDSGGPLQSGTVSARFSENVLLRNLFIPNSPRSAVSFEGAAQLRLTDFEIVNPWHLGVHGGFIDEIIVDHGKISGATQRIGAGVGQGVGWEDGGMKLTNGRVILVEDVEVVDGYGPGIWFDIHCDEVVIARNRVFGMTAEAIFYEISQSGLITKNLIRRSPTMLRPGRMEWCYGGGILVSTSFDVDVVDNEVYDSVHGIMVIDQSDRSDTPSGYVASDYSVRRNIVERVNKNGSCFNSDVTPGSTVHQGEWSDNEYTDVAQLIGGASG